MKYGRPFAGAPRPKGFRQWARKQCFRNASKLAQRDDGTYVEGFCAADGDGQSMFHHAWITIDGIQAIDPTLPDAERYIYFGVPIPLTAYGRLFARNLDYCVFDPRWISEVEAILLEEAGSSMPA